MRIAVISDIHGNLAALDAVLADIARRGADATVNLGDLLSGALRPAETADRLMALDMPTIRGNHERQILTFEPERMGYSDRHAAEAIDPRHREWLAGLPETLRLFDDVLLVHGTPGSDLTYFLETVERTGCRPAMEAEIAARAADADASLILCGHSHIPRSVRLKGGRQIVNPGSVGLQAFRDDHIYPHNMETGSPHARYAMIERTGEGWSVELLKVSYDWEGAAALAEANGQPEWARALRTGRV
ncbi:metallophosphoesterase family protein [Inquilinus sp. CAU 1745]|uniref:metallophosphoesterase family protein n=1 Tax=Inquilinus sp. CAU 1745 TaxID=3140369 RepID=UPI00325A9C0B